MAREFFIRAVQIAAASKICDKFKPLSNLFLPPRLIYKAHIKNELLTSLKEEKEKTVLKKVRVLALYPTTPDETKSSHLSYPLRPCELTHIPEAHGIVS